MKKNIVRIIILILIILTYLKPLKAETFEENITSALLTKEVSSDINMYQKILEIPKIKLKKGFYAINSPFNQVKYGIEVIKDDPNLLILASHSGNAKISYFKNLNKLENNDEVIISSPATKEYYKIVYHYEINKNGQFKVLNDGLDKKIILITCSKEDKTKQIVYVGKYEKKEV